MEYQKVETVRFAQAVSIDGMEEMFASTNLPKHRHLKMEWVEGNILKITGKQKLVFVPITNIGSWFPDLASSDTVDAKKPIEMHIPPKPPKSAA